MTATVGAKVEIDGLDIDPLTLQARFDRMQVADPASPFTNQFDLGPSAFDIDGLQIFAQRLIMDDLRVTQVSLGTKRTTSGALPKPPKPPTAAG